MSVLGQHGVDEVRQLMRTAEFRMERAKALINRLPFSNENVKLVKEWDDFVDERWKNAHDAVLGTLVTLRLDNPGAAESFIPAEKEFQIISKAINRTAGVISPGDLTDLIRRLEAASGQTLDEAGHPLPPDFDPDLEVFQRADAAIKSGENAVKKLEASLPSAGSLASRVPWWGWAIGLAAAGGVGYSVYKTGQQVNQQRKDNERYIKDNLIPLAAERYTGVRLPPPK